MVCAPSRRTPSFLQGLAPYILAGIKLHYRQFELRSATPTPISAPSPSPQIKQRIMRCRHRRSDELPVVGFAMHIPECISPISISLQIPSNPNTRLSIQSLPHSNISTASFPICNPPERRLVLMLIDLACGPWRPMARAGASWVWRAAAAAPATGTVRCQRSVRRGVLAGIEVRLFGDGACGFLCWLCFGCV
jgi:hypothetical protein